jgi:hypothetical protein
VGANLRVVLDLRFAAPPFSSVGERPLIWLRYGCRATPTLRAATKWSHPVGEGIGGKIRLFLPPAAKSFKRSLQAESQRACHIHLD